MQNMAQVCLYLKGKLSINRASMMKLSLLFFWFKIQPESDKV